MFWLAEVFNGTHTPEEMRRLEQWAHEERARTVAALFAAVARSVKAGFKGLGRLEGRARRWHRKREAIRELNALSDHVLKDIGLSRAEIRSVVEGLLDGRRPVRTTARTFDGGREAGGPSAAVAGRTAADQEWQRAA